MARILLSAFSNVGWVKERYHDTFVIGLMNALKRKGNDVLAVRCNDFLPHEHAGKHKPMLNKQLLLKEVKDFAPDLILTFNNLFPCSEFITETNCPIFLYPADGYDFFANKDLIDKYLERYVFLYVNRDNYNTFKENIKDIKESQLCPFSYATDFQRRDIPQDYPISFLGSIPNYSSKLFEYFKNWPYEQAGIANTVKTAYLDELERFKKAPYSKFQCDLPNMHPLPFSLETLAVFILTTKDRFEVLSRLTDLGLVIYGYHSFCMTAMYNYEILRAYNFELCVTQDQAETLYNRSKVSLNLPNARATCGFSWRVPDILATNSVLLSFASSDLADLMKGYADLPMYSSTAEARTLGEKLLKDDMWRKELSEASRRMVEDKCRFEPNFVNMERHLTVPLSSDREGSVADVYRPEMMKNFYGVYFHKAKRDMTKLLPFFIAKKILEPKERA